LRGKNLSMGGAFDGVRLDGRILGEGKTRCDRQVASAADQPSESANHGHISSGQLASLKGRERG
jgi:hypothetical protein